MRTQTYQALKRENAARRNAAAAEADEAFVPKDYKHLLGKLRLSDRLLTDHFALYQGYVKKLNEITKKLGRASRATANYSYDEYSELKRRESVPYNGVVLHELYFDNLAEAGKTKPDEQVKDLLCEGYGSFNAWVEDMKAAAMSAHGWAMTVYDPLEKKLKTNLIYSEHQEGVFAGARPIIVLDAWEHAYISQFGIRKADYVSAFFENLNWDVIEQRLSALGPTAPKN